MLKVRPKIKILSIIPGTRYLGVALLSGTLLKDWRIKVLNTKEAQNKARKAKKIIFDFIERYHPQLLAIKKLDPKRSSKKLDSLAQKIREFAKREKLAVRQMELSEIKKFIVGKRRINKKEIAELMVSRYPELVFEFKKEKKNKNTYYERMFEAVALGLACFYKVDGKHGKK